MLAVCNSERFCNSAPRAIVATLLDEGQYLASASTFYRILRAHEPRARAPSDRDASDARQTRAGNHGAQRAVELGCDQTAGSGKVDLVQPLSRARRLQPLHRWLGGRDDRIDGHR